jgi:2-dehydropantoate 2-reductase
MGYARFYWPNKKATDRRIHLLEERLNWLVFGAGAIGTYIGGSLLLRGHKVVFYDKAEAVTNILENGLRLNIEGQENRILHPVIYNTLPGAISHTSFDVSIFALKSYDTVQVLKLMRPFAELIPPVLCLQNGVENEPALESVLGKGKVIAGTVTSAIGRRAAGDILLERLRGMGVADGHLLSARLVPLLSDAGLNARLYSSPSAMKWSKMLTNLLANASSAILDMTPVEILGHPGLYQVEMAQLHEAVQVIHAQQIQIVDLPGTPVRMFAWTVSNLPPWLSHPFLSRIAGKGRGRKMPSFHIDLHSGRGKSEVDYLNGAVVRFGQRLGIPTPVNRWLNQTLLNLTQGSITMDVYSYNPEKYINDCYAHLGDISTST